MKKILLVLAIGAIVASCNDAAEKAPETTPEVTTPEVTTPAPDTTVKVDTAAVKIDTATKK